MVVKSLNDKQIESLITRSLALIKKNREKNLKEKNPCLRNLYKAGYVN